MAPPKWNVASVVMKVAMWNSGPEFRYRYSLVISCSIPMMRFWVVTAVCDNCAPLGWPVKAAV